MELLRLLLLLVFLTHVVQASVSIPNLGTFQQYAAGDLDFYPTNGKEWIRGGGATAVDEFMTNVVPAYMLVNNESVVSFASLGTTRGFCRLMDFLTQCLNPWAGTGTDIQRPLSLDFTVVTGGPSSSNYVHFPDIQLYPFGAAPIVLVHSVANLTAPLVVTRQMAAQIFRKCNLANPTYCYPGDIRYWNDSRIKALNPGQDEALDAAGEIQLLLRYDSAGMTAAVKHAFAIFETNFSLQISPSTITADNSTWRSVDAQFVYGLESIAAAVVSIPSSVSYLPLNVATELEMNIIWIATTNRSDALIANANTAVRALLERALDYGSDGTSPAHRTVEFSGSTNNQAWPIMMGAYIAVRLNTSRPNATCITRRELFKFALYLLQPDNPSLQTVADSAGVVRMPSEALTDNIAHITANFRCEGMLVSDMLTQATTYEVDLYVPEGFTAIGTILTSEYVQLVSSASSSALTVNVFELPGKNYTSILPFVNSIENVAQLIMLPRAPTIGSLSASSTLAQQDISKGQARIPFVGLAFVARYNWCGSSPISMTNCTTPTIDISSELLRDILSGSLLNWNDSRLTGRILNVGITFPNATIQVILPPPGPWRDAIIPIIQDLTSASSFTLSTLANAETFDSTELSLAFLQETQFSFFLTPSTTDESVLSDEQTTVASVNGVLPSLDTVTTLMQWRASPSSPVNVSNLYPIVMQMDLLVPKTFDQCNLLTTSRNAGGFLGIFSTVEESITSDVVDLLRWLVNFPETAATVQQAEAPASVAYELSLTEEDLIARVLSAIQGVALYNEKNVLNIVPQVTMRTTFFKSLVCSDGSSVVVNTEQLNLLPTPLIYSVGVGLATLSIVLFIALAFWVQCNRHRKVVKFASPAFLLQILVGATICVSTLYPLSMQEYNYDRASGPDPTEVYNLDIACGFIPWLYTLGYTIIFLGLFLKTWRLIKIFDNPRMKKFHRLRDKDLIGFIVVGVTFILLLNAAW